MFNLIGLDPVLISILISLNSHINFHVSDSSDIIVFDCSIVFFC